MVNELNRRVIYQHSHLARGGARDAQDVNDYVPKEQLPAKPWQSHHRRDFDAHRNHEQGLMVIETNPEPKKGEIKILALVWRMNPSHEADQNGGQ